MHRSSLERFVPRVATEWDLDGNGAPFRQIDGTLCFVDISGFTNLSERLARRGRIGAEELTEVLDRVFGEMLRLAYDRGGSLLKFGGDALLLMFEGEDHPIQGTSAAVEMRAALREASRIPTSVGRIPLRMSVGLNTGLIDLYLVGEAHRELIITGHTASVTTEMEGLASAGEILVSQALCDRLPRRVIGGPKESGWLLRTRQATVDPVGPLVRRPVDAPVLARCLPTVLRSHLATGPVEPEHRLATVGFVKFQGVDAVRAAGGHESVADGLDRLIRTVQEAADAEGVTFLASDIDTDGGKVILTTGVPGIQVDDEGRMLRAVRRIADGDNAFPLKIGVNRGHVFAGEIGTDFRSTYTVMGDTVNLAARLMASAPPGEILAAPNVLDRARTLFTTTALEPFYVKGKSEPVQAYAVGPEAGGRTAGFHRELPFAGRADELATIRRAIEGVTAGSGGIVTIVGATGLGKSRLVSEAVDAPSGPPALRIQGEANGTNNPYWALRDPLRDLLGIARQSQQQMAALLAAAVGALDVSLLPLLPLLGDVTHIAVPDTAETAAIEPRFRPLRTADALAALLAAARPGPLVIVAEDRHWFDPATVGLLERLTMVPRPWLLLVTTRPDAGLGLPEGNRIELDGLDESVARAIAIIATQAAPLRPHELDAIVARAGGNPLFLEEILRLIRETGDAESLPESLDAVVGAEIDSLPALARRLLRYSSVLGRSFRRVLLDELLAPEGVVLDSATRQSLALFITEDGPERWRFRHAVTHDVAYEGLAYRKRKELHARAGEVIERLAGDDTSAVAEFLAFHYARAGRHDAAWRHGVVAGDKARRSFANVEAVEHYRRALEATRRMPVAAIAERARVFTSLGDVQEQAGEYEAAEASFAAALRLLREGPPVDRADLLLRRARAKMRSGRYPAAIADLTKGGRLVTDETAEALGAHARLESFRAVVRVNQERYREALAAAFRAEASASRSGEREALARAYGALDWAYYRLGQAEKAIYGVEALAIYTELGQPDKAADVMINLGAWAYFEGRWDDAINWYEQARAESRRAGNEIAAASATINIAELRLGQGRLADAEPDVRDAVRTFRAAGDAHGGLFAELQLGRLLTVRGALDEALEIFDRLGREAVELGQLASALEVTTHRAAALIALGRPATALDELAAAEDQAGEEAALLRAAVARARADAYVGLGKLDEALTQVETGLDTARANSLAYDEALLLDLRDSVAGRLGQVEHQDAERREALRIQLGLGSATTTAG